MTPIRTAAFVICALATSCTAINGPQPGANSKSATPLVVDASLVRPNPNAVVPAAPLPGEPPPRVLANGEAIGIAPPEISPVGTASVPSAPLPARPSTGGGVAKAVSPAAKAPAQIAALHAPPEKPREPAAATGLRAAGEELAGDARKPEQPLDVASLKARLRDTDAIGVFTKLALGNQMDDLLKKFRTFHQSGQKSGLAALRPPFDTLLSKVLSVLQGGDPSLAGAISGSREAIWGILADPVKFASAS